MKKSILLIYLIFIDENHVLIKILVHWWKMCRNEISSVLYCLWWTVYTTIKRKLIHWGLFEKNRYYWFFSSKCMDLIPTYCSLAHNKKCTNEIPKVFNRVFSADYLYVRMKLIHWGLLEKINFIEFFMSNFRNDAYM